MKASLNLKRSRRLKLLATTAGLVAAIMVLSPPFVLKSSKNPARAEAINNLKQIGLELQVFDAEYDSFPNDSTAAKVRAATQTELSLIGSSANAMFRQLIASGCKSEKPFYCSVRGASKPDDRLSDDAHALAPGECGFAYVAGLSSSMDTDTPVVMAPLIPGTRRFDRSRFGGKAMILCLDQTVRVMPVNSSGQVIYQGRDIFDPRQTFWRGKPPDLRLPE